ncbi:MAG TPA: hypothetical protein VMP01_13725 [Pirellulaceae bacterium]|nr:hypothetical protein [Pirellulaceae bacterium]
MITEPCNSNRQKATKWSVVRCCALVMVALASALAWQDMAEASCGDYVFVRDAQGRLVRAADLAAGGPMAADHSAMPSSAPCHGPQCSRLPSAPPAEPLAPSRSLSPPEALLSHLGDQDSFAGGGGWSTDPEPAHPIHHPGRIFRPPRS